MPKPEPELKPKPKPKPKPEPKPEPTTPTPADENVEEDEYVVEEDEYDFELVPPPGDATAAGVVNAQVVDVTDAKRPKWMREMWSQTTAAVNVDAHELAGVVRETPEALSHAKPGESLFVTFATESVKDFVHTWIESARALKLSPLFVGALDEGMLKWCEDREIPSMLLSGNSVLKGRGRKFITAGDEHFKKMGSVKTKFIQDLLELNIAPILTDADVTWLRDPRPYFNKGTYALADALVSTDCIDIPGDARDENACAHVNFNTGVLHFRPSNASKAFVETWKNKVASSTIAWMRDQPAFNLLTHEGVPGHALSPATAVPREKKGKPGHRMLYHAANASLLLGVLPNWLFGNGHTYFVQWHHETHAADGAPYSVHMTYQYGDTGAYAYGKRERMRQAGIWRADPPAFYGDGDDDVKFLVIADEGAQMRFPDDEPATIGTDREAHRVAIARHLQEDKLRRTTVRNGLALAKALGRVLVLPRARCYCDKIWNNLNACRAPGAETFTLPYACPMDHIYDLPRWFDDVGRGVLPDFREPGFLSDARVPSEVRASRGRIVVDRAGDARAGYPAWSSGGGGDAEAEDVVRLRHGFTAADAVAATAALASKRVVEVDYLGGAETFCGFAADAKNAEFDAVATRALTNDQYYCFTEPWHAMGSPRGGRSASDPYEPQVVTRHCGASEEDMIRSGRVTRGEVTHLGTDDGCTCEWGFARPKPLTEVSKGEACKAGDA